MTTPKQTLSRTTQCMTQWMTRPSREKKTNSKEEESNRDSSRTSKMACREFSQPGPGASTGMASCPRRLHSTPRGDQFVGESSVDNMMLLLVIAFAHPHCGAHCCPLRLMEFLSSGKDKKAGLTRRSTPFFLCCSRSLSLLSRLSLSLAHCAPNALPVSLSLSLCLSLCPSLFVP